MPVTKCAGRSGARWRRAVEQLRREAPPICHLCGKSIDMMLHYLDPMAWQADHVPSRGVLLARGDDPDDVQWLRPSHRVCNQRKGDRDARPKPVASKRW
ncbi:hypothetical protein [Streptomyces sp. NPDC059009]|uniref:hypothetical protein n=1 Tax=Streptomyces sp. NPDC059009 TaxID=3346694 RepID=UPI00367E0974